MKKYITFALFFGLSLQGLNFQMPILKAVDESLFINQIEATSISPILWQQNNEPIKIRVEITAYSSTPDQTDSTPFITASGKRVNDGIIAANFLPFGTKVKIPELFGDKIFIVEDRMAPRYFHKIDIWFANRQAARRFGAQEAEIVIL